MCVQERRLRNVREGDDGHLNVHHEREVVSALVAPGLLYFSLIIM